MMQKIALFLLAAAGMAVAQPRVAAFSMGRALGDPHAPVKIELFSDYECPACKVFHDQTLQALIENYVKKGKVYLVRREFPLTNVHPHSLEAARIACAAEKIGHYSEICDQLFRTQESWTKSGDVMGAACRILSPADAMKLRKLATTTEVASAVDEDVRLALSERVGGTPTMVITKMVRRYPVTGPVSYDVLSRFVDSILR